MLLGQSGRRMDPGGVVPCVGGRQLYKTTVQAFLLGASMLWGCAGQTKTNTAHDEKVEAGEAATEHAVSAEHKMPESPKVKADDKER